MPANIKMRDGKVWIQNPVNPLENFADRWKDHPESERKLRTWLTGLEAALDEVLTCKDQNKVSKLLEALFGEKVTQDTIKKFTETAGTQTKTIYPVVSITHTNKPWRP
jgi:hypothetical protein